MGTLRTRRVAEDRNIARVYHRKSREPVVVSRELGPLADSIKLGGSVEKSACLDGCFKF